MVIIPMNSLICDGFLSSVFVMLEANSLEIFSSLYLSPLTQYHVSTSLFFILN